MAGNPKDVYQVLEKLGQGFVAFHPLVFSSIIGSSDVPRCRDGGHASPSMLRLKVWRSMRQA
jgi:hypothetical protein